MIASYILLRLEALATTNNTVFHGAQSVRHVFQHRDPRQFLCFIDCLGFRFAIMGPYPIHQLIFISDFVFSKCDISVATWEELEFSDTQYCFDISFGVLPLIT